MNRRKLGAGLSLMAAVCMLGLCSCSFFRAEQLTELMSDESKMITEKSVEVIRCLTEGDKEGLAALFCEEIRATDSFQQDVDIAFDFFTCEVYIKSQVEELAGGSQSMESGKITNWSVSPEITYIEVLQKVDGSEETVDRFYSVRYLWQITDTEHPQREGLQYLEIRLLNMDQAVEIGVYE